MKLSCLPATVAATASIVAPVAAFKFHSLQETAHIVEECYRLAWFDRTPPPPRCHDLVHFGFSQLYLHGYEEGRNRGIADGAAQGFRQGFAEGMQVRQTSCPVVDWDALREEATAL